MHYVYGISMCKTTKFISSPGYENLYHNRCRLNFTQVLFFTRNLHLKQLRLFVSVGTLPTLLVPVKGIHIVASDWAGITP